MGQRILPKVVVVGRPNVGKSSLMNMFANRRVSIVDSVAGITRDRVSTLVDLSPGNEELTLGYQIEMVDTGGHGIVDSQDLTVHVESQIALGLAEADLILFLIDAQTGVLPLDEQVAKLLRTANSPTPVLLVANKTDSEKMAADAMDAYRLGYGDPICVSSTTKYNRTELVGAIRDQLKDFKPRKSEVKQALDTGVLMALVGKRNAGKSTLVNEFARDKRVIVSEVEGTTRDSVDVRFEMKGEVYTAIDTAGVRRRKSVKEDVEYYAMHRSLRSIRRADVVMLVIDATVAISQVDMKLCSEIVKHDKPVIFVINKWDLAEARYTQEEFVSYLDQALKSIPFAPIAFVSAQDGDGIRALVNTAKELYHQASKKVGTGELNRVVEMVLSEKTPTSKGGKQPKVYYATQIGTHPPRIALFTNKPSLFDSRYLRFFVNRLRDHLPFPEVPIKLILRGRQGMEKPVEQ